MNTNEIKSMSTTVSNLKSEYAKACKSFNFAVRFILDLSKESAKELPPVPAKDDKSEEANMLRKEINTAKKYNDAVESAKHIVDIFGIDANSIKSKTIASIQAKVKDAYPYKTQSGLCVTLGNLPKYMQERYKDTYAIVPANWIEILARSAKSKDMENKTFETITIAPIVEKGELIDRATGILVKSDGTKIKDCDKILAIWDTLAVANNKASREGQNKKHEVFAELTK